MRALLLGICGLLVWFPAGAVEIALKSRGGDAWAFEKRLEAHVSGGTCDEVRLVSPVGSVTALPSGEDYAGLVPLRPGPNEVWAICRHAGRIRQSRSEIWNLRLSDRPTARIRFRTAGSSILLDAGASTFAPRSAAPLVSFAWAGAPGSPALIGMLGEDRRMELPAPQADGLYHVTLRVTDGAGISDESTIAFRVSDGRAEAVDQAERPAWMERAIIYGVVPKLFGERGLPDVTARLDAIAATGANTVWLSPITDAPGQDFGYAVSDHFRLRQGIGSESDLRDLVQAAHRRGMRVIMDFVPNHLSDRHPYFRDLLSRGAASAYADYFQAGPDGQPAHYFDWSNLKNLNYDNQEVRRMMIAAFAHWVRAFGIDGFRVDAAWGVRERAPEFWREWRTELKRINPDLLLLAETSARDPWYVANGFDAAYDWGEELGQWAWKDVFRDTGAALDVLRDALAVHDGRTPVLRFLNNNDTGARFVERHGLDLTRAAAAMIFTLPGLPLIYAGDELAATYEPYSEVPPLRWDGEAPLRDLYRRLADLREQQPALRTNRMTLVRTERPESVLAYRRDELLVLVNFSGERQSVGADADGPFTDLLSGERVESGDVELEPHGARVLKPDRVEKS